MKYSESGAKQKFCRLFIYFVLSLYNICKMFFTVLSTQITIIFFVQKTVIQSNFLFFLAVEWHSNGFYPLYLYPH